MKKISNEDFVTRWQKAKTYAAAVAAVEMDARHASLRASYFRRKGIPLQSFGSGGTRVDVEGLKKLAGTGKP